MPVTNLGQALNIDSNPTFSPQIIAAINNFRDKVVPMGSAKADEWKNNPASNYIKVDAREIKHIPWFLSDNLLNPQESFEYKDTLEYPFKGKNEKYQILDIFYEKKRTVDYRTYDFSALTGNDTSEKDKDSPLTKSEKDVINFLKDLATNQAEQTLIAENPDYYFNSQDMMTPKEKYLAEINSEYLSSSLADISMNLKEKQGYQDDWSEELKNEYINSYQEGINDYSSTYVTNAEHMEISHQIYSYRMAMVNGEENPPKPELTCKIPARWNTQEIKNLARQIRQGKITSGDFKKQLDACDNMCNALFPEFDCLMGKVPDGIERMDNIFIDGQSAREYFADAVNNKGYDKREQKLVYKALLMDTILSGEHTVESGIRYMDNYGNMNMEFFAVEPDLSAVAEAEKASYSWFRKLFDWGPFKISTCKTKQEARRAADNNENKEKRHSSINNKYKPREKTIKNSNQIVFPENEIEQKKERGKVLGAEKQPFESWVKSTKADIRIDIGGESYDNNMKILCIRKSENKWDLGKAFTAATDKLGIGNAVDIFCRMDKVNGLYTNCSSTTQKAIKKFKDDIPDDYKPKISNDMAFNKLMDHFFKHGGMEHPDCTMILNVADELASTHDQRAFVNTLKVFNQGRMEYDAQLQALAEKSVKYEGDEKISAEQMSVIQKGQAQIKLNKILCDSITSKLSSEKSFDKDILEGTEVQTLNSLGDDNGKAYNQLLNKVIENAEIKAGEPKTVDEALKMVHEDINKVPENIKGALANVVEKNMDVIDADLSQFRQKAKEAANNDGPKVSQNPVLA